MAKAVIGYIHPSMIKVTELTEDFLKKAHKIMRDKGYKLSSGTQSAAADWMYEKAGTPTVWMHGWHGRDPRKWGAGKTVWNINVEGSGKNEYIDGADCEILSCTDIESVAGTRHNMLQLEKIKQYEDNLKKALEFLQNIDIYIVTMIMTA